MPYCTAGRFVLRRCVQHRMLCTNLFVVCGVLPHVKGQLRTSCNPVSGFYNGPLLSRCGSTSRLFYGYLATDAGTSRKIHIGGACPVGLFSFAPPCPSVVCISGPLRLYRHILVLGRGWMGVMGPGVSWVLAPGVAWVSART